MFVSGQYPEYCCKFYSYTNNFIKWPDKLPEDNPEVGEYVVRTVDKYSGDMEKWMNDLFGRSEEGMV